MENVNVLLLLLLLCSLSGADLQNNEIVQHRRASAESVNVLGQPEPCPSDLHAVLRDVVAKLAVLQTKMEQLEKENQEHATKWIKNHVEIQELHNLNQEQASKLKDLQTKTNEVDPMKEELRGQAAELNSIKIWTNVTEKHVDSLRRDREVGRVAFSASLWASGSGYIGPISAHTTLVFRHVISNIGNAYNPSIGIFTAPVRGAYHFEYYVVGIAPTTVLADLIKNGEHILATEQHQTSGWGTGANGATLILEAGDVVFVQLYRNYRTYDNERHYSTFSGHLIFPM